MPYNVSSKISSSAIVAGQFGHSAQTHKTAYSTECLHELYEFFSDWHSFFGDNTNLLSKMIGSSRSNAYDDIVGLALLRALVGNRASWRPNQAEAVRVQMTDGNSIIMNSCGGGKSLCWMIMILALILFPRHQKKQCIVVVLPYASLAKEKHQGTNLVSEKLGVVSQLIESKDVGISDTIPLLSNDGSPNAHVVYVSVNAWHLLLDRYKLQLRELCKKKVIARIFFDEPHEFLGECTIRFDVWMACLHRAANLHAPLTVLSATLPFYKGFMKLMGMKNPIIVGSGEFVYPKSFVELNSVKSFTDMSMQVGPKIGRLLKRRVGNIHVVSTSKALLSSLHLELVGQGHDAGLLTANTDEEEVDDILLRWAKGDLQILLSTFIPGTDSSHVANVVILGSCWNLLSLTQAFGRIREGKQVLGSQIVMYHLNPTPGGTYESRLKAIERKQAIRLGGAEIFDNESPDDMRIFEACICPMSVHMALTKPGCPIANISDAMGSSDAPSRSCGRCNRCLDNKFIEPCRIQASNAVVQLQMEEEEALLRRRNISEFLRNELMSFTCKSIGFCLCDAARCQEGVGKSSCFGCGSPRHGKKDCLVSTKEIFEGLGVCGFCYYFLDDETVHHSGNGAAKCDLGARLKRLLMHHSNPSARYLISQNQDDLGEAYCIMLEQIYSNREAFDAYMMEIIQLYK